MILREKKWVLPEETIQSADASVLERLLYRRGYTNEGHTSLPDDHLKWHDPFLFPDMLKACDRIEESIRNNQTIVIYGDYDADGISAASLIYLFFKECNVPCRFVIPERIQDGYGISSRYVEECKTEKNILLLTVDCGISNTDEIKTLKDAGIDVIVTDHHEVNGDLPDAVAVLDAKRKDSEYPFSQLCGAGAALKLAQALCQRGISGNEKLWEKYIDLAAIGTIADIVPLRDENRMIVKQALNKMKKELRPGIKALLHASGKADTAIVSSTIGFTLAPRINAAGRMGSASRSVELLIAEDELTAGKIAAELVQENTKRQEIEQEILKQVIEKLEHVSGSNVYENSGPIVVWDKNWHPGVIGIVASKLVDRYDRSVIILSAQEEPGMYKGSARACGDDHILEAILYAKEYTEKCGGHQKAAGLSVREDNIENFAGKIREYASIANTPPVPEIQIDLNMQASEVTIDMYKEIMQLEPFGEENPEPVYYLEKCTVLSVCTRGNGQHLSLKINCGTEDGADYIFDTIFFRGGHLEKLYIAGSLIDIVFSLSISTWKEKEQLSIVISEIRFAKTGQILMDKPEVLEELFKNNLPLKQMQPLLKTKDQNLSISKEDIKKVYIYFNGQLRDQIVYCDYKLLATIANHTCGSTLTPFSIARILDVFEEALLIKIYNKDAKSVCFRLLSVDKKVKLTDTSTYNRMLTEGGVVT